MQPNRIVSRDEWLAARKQHLSQEKAFTRLRDELSRQRRELPWVRVEKRYGFDGPDGQETLANLFDGRSQLIVVHFMFAPGWEEGCKSCSFRADHLDGALVHLAHRDVTLVVVSRAPLPQIDAFKKRMGWRFTWVSSYGTDFNRDFHVSFTKDDMAKGQVYYNLRLARIPERGSPRHQRVLQGRERRHLSHLFLLRARGRHVDRRVPLPRPRAEGPRRRRLDLYDGVGSPPRSVR